MAHETWHVVSRELDGDGHCLYDEHEHVIETRESLLSKDAAVSRFMELISNLRSQHPGCTIRAYIEEREETDEYGGDFMVPAQVFTTNNDIHDYLKTISLIDMIIVSVLRENEEAPVCMYEMFLGVDL